MRHVLASIPLVLLGAAGVAHAQAELVQTDAAKTEDKDIQGWNPFLSLTSTLSVVDNSSVIGQPDGFSTLFGLGVLGGADYIDGPHLLRTNLVLNEAFARTPVVDKFVKTNDVFKVDEIYNYFVTKYAGGYVRASVATSLLPGYDVRGTPTTWVDATGMTPTPLNSNALEQKLADAFKPLTFIESAGAFSDPVRMDEFTLSLRLGIGGRQTFADGVYVNHDDPTTSQIELLQLSDVDQLGAEAFAGAVGKLDNGKANYKVGVAVLWPFVNNDKYDRSSTYLTRVAFDGNLTYAMSKWLSLVYSVAVTRDPQLFPKDKELVQVQNTVLLTFQLNLVTKKEKPKAKTKEQLELEAAKKEAADAEKRASDAEQKLKDLQQKEQEQQTPPTPLIPPTPPVPTPATPPESPAPAPTPTP